MEDSILLGSPELILAVLPVLILLVWQTALKRRFGAYALTGLELLQSRQYLKGSIRKLIRAFTWAVFLVILGLLWMDPVIYTRIPLFDRGSQTLHKNFIVAFDMSPSMNLPVGHKGFGGDDLTSGQEGVTRYETAREALFDFLQRFEGERFGLILFSTEPFLARWPTTETGNRFLEVLGDNIRRGSGSQLEAFSSLTNIDKALTLAQDVLGEEEGAIIMISDAEDDIENLGQAVQGIRDNNIRLYTIGVGVPEEITARLSQRFSADPGFRIFQVDSEEEMREAYRVVGEVEESPIFSRVSSNYRNDLRWILALIAVPVLALIIWLDQKYFHRSTNAYTGQGMTGTKRYGIQ